MDEDGEDAAEAFDVEKDMKTMWGHVWSLAGWNKLWRMQVWTMLLVGICIFARASELCEFCPTFEDTSLPESGAQWDSDGLPKYIEVALREWKTRTTCHMGKKYKMRLWRNYLDPRFCPVTWLVTWLHYSDIRNCPLFQSFEGGRPSGTHMSTTQWTGATGRLFTAAGLYEPGHYTEGVEEEMGEWVPAAGVTNHGIRRSACQWAGRCGADSLDVSNGSRHKTLTELAKYMGQGAKMRSQYTEDAGSDPIFFHLGVQTYQCRLSVDS